MAKTSMHNDGSGNILRLVKWPLQQSRYRSPSITLHLRRSPKIFLAGAE